MRDVGLRGGRGESSAAGAARPIRRIGSRRVGRPGSLRLIRGPLALQAIITLGEGDVLQLRGTVTAVVADYAPAPAQQACTLVLVDYPDQGSASSAFAHLREGLDPEIKVLAAGEGSLVFRDYSGKFGSVVAAGRRLTLRVNLASDPRPDLR